MNKNKNKNGFTLIEILVTISIISIVLILIITSISYNINKSKEKGLYITKTNIISIGISYVKEFYNKDNWDLRFNINNNKEATCVTLKQLEDKGYLFDKIDNIKIGYLYFERNINSKVIDVKDILYENSDDNLEKINFCKRRALDINYKIYKNNKDITNEHNKSNWYNKDIEIELYTNDETSKIKYCLDESCLTEYDYNDKIKLTESNKYSISAYAVNNYKVSKKINININIDKIKPTFDFLTYKKDNKNDLNINSDITKLELYENNTWYSGYVFTKIVNINDNLSGINSIKYKVNGASANGERINREFRNINAEGITNIEFEICDNANNCYTQKRIVKLDRTPPRGYMIDIDATKIKTYNNIKNNYIFTELKQLENIDKCNNYTGDCIYTANKHTDGGLTYKEESCTDKILPGEENYNQKDYYKLSNVNQYIIWNLDNTSSSLKNTFVNTHDNWTRLDDYIKIPNYLKFTDAKIDEKVVYMRKCTDRAGNESKLFKMTINVKSN